MSGTAVTIVCTVLVAVGWHLDSARDDLTAVVRQALEPAYVSVWIRPGE
jgi:hypothetical protein